MGNWLKRLSLLALIGFPLAVVGMRLGLYEFGISFEIIKATVYLSVVVFVLGVAVFFFHRVSKPASSTAARTAVIICLIPLLGIGSQLMKARSVPSIHNISTDVVNPPEFSRIAQLRGADDNPLEYDTATLADVQTKAYPQIKTLVSNVSPEQAHKRALVIAEALGWDIVDENMTTGIVEATESSALWGFKDDVVIRIRASNSDSGGASGSLIDLRSVSRIGRSDLGANAARIQRFTDAFQQ